MLGAALALLSPLALLVTVRSFRARGGAVEIVLPTLHFALLVGLFGGLLAKITHHRALAGVTFGVMSALLAVLALLAFRRLARTVWPRRAQMFALVVGMLVLATASLWSLRGTSARFVAPAQGDG